MTRKPFTHIFKAMILSAVCLIACVPSASAKQVAGLWDASGNMLLPIEYDEIRRDGDKFIARKSHTDENGKTTQTEFEIDKSGKRLTEPHTVPTPAPYQTKIEPKFKIPDGWKFESNFDFGCTLTKEKNQRAFVDSKGILTILPADCLVEPVGPALFLKHTFPDAGGEILELLGAELKPIAVLPGNIQLMNGHFEDGLLKVRSESGTIAFLNTDGKFQIKPSTISDAEDFKRGKCKVKLITHGGDAAAIIDRNGNVVAGPYEKAEFPYIFRDSDQLVVEFERKRAGVITDTGKEVIPFDYDFILEFEDKYVGRKNEQWSIFAHDGKIIRTFPKSICNVEPCGNLWRFSEGGDGTKLQNTFRGSPYPGSKWGLMDDAGKVVIPAQFIGIGSEIEGGLLLVTNSAASPTAWGVLNVNTKKIVLEPGFETIALKDGFIFVYKDNNEFYPTGRGVSTQGWTEFLFTYDLIGMKKSKVEALLGVPQMPYKINTVADTSSARYTLSSSCTGWSGIEIEFNSKGEAIGWRDVTGADAGQWLRDNYVQIRNQDGRPPLVVPKKGYKPNSGKL